MEIKAVHAFRVTRNADIRRDEEEADDLLEMISEELRERRFARVVRLEVDPTCRMTCGLCSCRRALDRARRHVRERKPPRAGRRDGLDEAGPPRPSGNSTNRGSPSRRRGCFGKAIPRIWCVRENGGLPNIFAAIREDDLLVHHPYESFQHSAQRFVDGGRQRPRRAGDQANALPHLQQQPDRRGPRGRGREAASRSPCWSR